MAGSSGICLPDFLVPTGPPCAQPVGEEVKYPKEVYFDFRGKPIPPELTMTPEGADIEFQRCDEIVVQVRMKRTGSSVSYRPGRGPEGAFEEFGSKNFGLDDIHEVTLSVLTRKQPYSVDARKEIGDDVVPSMSFACSGCGRSLNVSAGLSPALA